MAATPRGRGRKLSLFAVLLACPFLASPTCDMSPTTPVGGIAGTFSVSDDGGSTYMIPLELPPGVGDAVPSLSIVYSSDGGDGLLGMGFALHGLSSITRCSRNASLDGTIRSVDFTAEDAYCLDGQRLVELDGGEYRLEEEQFSRIESFGSAGTGPEWFRVTTKDGVQREYGRDPVGRIDGQGLPPALAGSVRVYALTKLIEPSGNDYTVTYARDDAVGDFRPQLIRYSGNEAIGEIGRVTVAFLYEDRPYGDAAAARRYIGPAYVSTSKRLTSISTWVDMAPNGVANVRDYRLSYEGQLSERGRSRLASIRECDGTPFFEDHTCRPVTAFSWADGFAGIDSSFSTDPADHMRQLFVEDAFLATTPYAGDFDGDGVSDVYMVGDESQYFCSGRDMEAEGGCTAIHSGTWESDWDLFPGDYDGDGRTDFFMVAKSRAESRFCPATYLTGSGSCTTLSLTWSPSDSFHPADYDGDARTDLLVVRDDQQWFCDASAVTGSAGCVAPRTPVLPVGAELHPADFNGDGVADVLAILGSSATVCDGRALGPAGTHGCFSYGTGSDWLAGYDVYIGDFNGDSQEDLFLVGDAAIRFCAGPGVMTADNCVRIDPAPLNWRRDFDYYVGDFNGDGATDVGRVHDDGVDFCQAPYIAEELFCFRVLDQPGLREPEVAVVPGDFNGDGVPDFLVLQPALRDDEIGAYACDIASLTNTYTVAFGGTSSSGNSFTASYRYSQVVTLQNPVPDSSNTCYYAGSRPSRSQSFPVLTQALQFSASVTLAPWGGNEVTCNVGGGHGLNQDVAPYTRTRTASNQGTWTYREITYLDYLRFEAFDWPIAGGAPICPCYCYYEVTTGSATLNAPAAEHVDTRTASWVTVPTQVPTMIVHLAEGRMGPIDVVDGIRVGLEQELGGPGTGYGIDYSIAYAPLTNMSASLYTPGTGSDHPVRDAQPARFVVRSVTMPSGVGPVTSPDTYTLTYSYHALRSDVKRRRSLGFERVTVTDSRPGALRTVREFRQDGLLAGKLGRTVRYNGDLVVSQTTTSWSIVPSDACERCGHPRITAVAERSFELDGQPTRTRTTTFGDFDLYGNPRDVTVAFDNEVTGQATEYSKTMQLIYFNSTTPWRIGLPQVAYVTGHGAAGTTETRTSAIAYDALGRLQATISHAGDPTAQIVTEIVRDVRGLPKRVTTSVLDPGSPPRVQIARYDAYGLPMEYENALGHLTSVHHDPRHGKLLKEIDPNGVVTTRTYDGFGRLKQTVTEGGPTVSFSYQDCEGDCPSPEGRLATIRTESGSAATAEIFDVWGRTVGLVTGDDENNPIYRAFERDAFGRTVVSSAPSFESVGSRFVLMEYDAFGRLVEMTPSGPGDRTTFYDYAPLQLTTTTPDPGEGRQVTVYEQDSLGNTVRVIDALSQPTDYSYDVFGNLLTVTDPVGNLQRYEYDQAGRRTHMVDPTMGAWDFAHNGFGDLVVEESLGTGRRISRTFDALGREIERREAFGATTTEIWTSEYDPVNGVGRLHRSYSADQSQMRELSYDVFARLRTTTTWAAPPPGSTAAPAMAQASYSYDDHGRLAQLDLPGLSVGYDRAADGTLSGVRSGGFTFWQALERDAERRITRSSHGHGIPMNFAYAPDTGELEAQYDGSGTSRILRYSYGYDELGNLRSRKDWRYNAFESFGYDRLNRLRWSKVSDAPRFYNAYDAVGNMTCTRSDSASSCASGSGAVLGYDGSYGANAVTSISHVPLWGLNVNGREGAFEKTFQYDADGYQTARLNMDSQPSRVIVTNPLGRVTHVWDQDAGESRYVYDADQHLVWRTATMDSSTIDVFRPFDGYERWQVDAVVSHRITLRMPDGTHVVYATPDDSLPFDPTRASYVYSDHLGSATVVADHSGSRVEERDFDGIGRRVDPDTGRLVAPDPVSARLTDLSFTGQREEPGLNLHNYGARFYDPTIGRFLQPDTIIQAPYNPQNLNRYSYVLNDPLNLVDPSGNVLVRFDRGVTVWDEFGGFTQILPGDVYDVNYLVGGIYSYVSATGKASAGGAPAYFLATPIDRPSSAPSYPGVVTASGEPTLVGTVSSEVRRSFDELTGGFVDREAQLAFLDAVSGISPGYDQLARDYFNDTANRSEWTDRLCSSWCRLDSAQADAATAYADLVALESWWLANLRISARVELGIQVGGLGLSASVGVQYGVERGDLGLKFPTDFASGWTSESSRFDASVPLILRWDRPDSTSVAFEMGGATSGQVMVSSSGGSTGVGGIGVVYGNPLKRPRLPNVPSASVETSLSQ